MEKDYKVVKALTMNGLAGDVNKLMEDGYTPLGGVCYGQGILYQALLK